MTGSKSFVIYSDLPSYSRLVARRRVSFVKSVDLEILYHKNNMTQKDLGNFYGISTQTIGNLLKKFNLKPKSKATRNQTEENHHSWRKDPSYRTLHKRVEFKRGKLNLCEECGTIDPDKKYEWANISGDYLNHHDFKRLCIDCHSKEHPRERDSVGRFK